MARQQRDKSPIEFINDRKCGESVSSFEVPCLRATIKSSFLFLWHITQANSAVRNSLGFSPARNVKLTTALFVCLENAVEGPQIHFIIYKLGSRMRQGMSSNVACESHRECNCDIIV